MSNDNLVAENALADAIEAARALGRKFTDDDVKNGELGDLSLAARQYVLTTDKDKDNGFIRSLKLALVAKGSLSIAQERGALNVMRHDLKIAGDAAEMVPEEEMHDEPSYVHPNPERRIYDCFKCGKPVVGLSNIRNHKQSEHTNKPVAIDGESCLAEAPSLLGLDLSEVPNGYYALPNVNPEKYKGAFIFIRISRTKQTGRRTRRYVYGKERGAGNEIVPAGTLEVRDLSSDQKRLCGEQRPDDVYRGEFEAQMPLIQIAPETWAKIFGQQIGRCGRCGKKLTDDESRQVGLGPECIKHGDYWLKYSKTAYNPLTQSRATATPEQAAIVLASWGPDLT